MSGQLRKFGIAKTVSRSASELIRAVVYFSAAFFLGWVLGFTGFTAFADRLWGNTVAFWVVFAVSRSLVVVANLVLYGTICDGLEKDGWLREEFNIPLDDPSGEIMGFFFILLPLAEIIIRLASHVLPPYLTH